MKKHIPSLLTLANLLIGCMGIYFVFNDRIYPERLQAEDELSTRVAVLFGFSSRLYLASFCILLAALFDFLDGMVARLLKVNSEQGVQLDSLADVVSFGVLPGMIAFQLLTISHYSRPDALYVPVAYSIPALLLPAAAAWRLSRFNVSSLAHYFTGLPTPACAIFFAALPGILFLNSAGLAPLIIHPWFLYGAIALFSVLMISQVRMISLKVDRLSWKGNEWKIAVVAGALLPVVFFQYAGAAAAVLIYIVLSLLQSKLQIVKPT
jgi:CDP-diacylglycerol--serine O-phosphatidyltransferase